MYQALYRKWRPQVFEDVYGQDHITSILKNEVESGKISHAYLFCGPRGTGKTTCAKIIAKAANCEHPVNGSPCCHCPSCLAIDNGTTTDVIEMDAASNNGVDDIRDIRDGVVYTPADLKYKVYIIDEVHMLSIQAFNALLKTLEEPPKHVIFILATTELQKIPATILSRCQRFDFRRVAPSALIERMKVVCAGEKIEADDEALSLIARLSQGAFRDALNMLEFCASDGKKITRDSAAELLGASSSEMLAAFAGAIAKNDVAGVLDMVNEVYLSSRDIAVFWRELISFLRDVLVCAVTKNEKTTGELCTSVASSFAPAHLVRVIEEFTGTEADMARTPSSAKLYAEIALIKATEPTVKNDTAALESRVADLEQAFLRLSSGKMPAAMPLTLSPEKPAVPAEKTEKKGSSEAAKPSGTPVNTDSPAPDSRARAVRKWSDIIRIVTKECPPVDQFIRHSIGKVTPDGTVTVCFDKPFYQSAFQKNQSAVAVLMKAYTTVLGEPITREQLHFETVTDPEEVTRLPIDDLIEKLQNSGDEEQ